MQLHHENLAPLKGLGRTCVFPSLKSQAGHITNATRLEWNSHAHCRTFATVAMEAGGLEEIVGRSLHHLPLPITRKRYLKPSLDALRPSIETVCDELQLRIANHQTETALVCWPKNLPNDIGLLNCEDKFE